MHAGTARRLYSAGLNGLDLLDLAILALRLALVAVLYGFLLVVLRSARRSLLHAAAPRRAAEPPRRLDLWLIVLAAGGSGLPEGHAIEVADGFTLGRGQRAEMVLSDAAVSAEHARVTRVGRDWVVRDLGSTNGTLVNGSRVNGQTSLRHGDVLALGGVQFRVALRAAWGEDQA